MSHYQVSPIRFLRRAARLYPRKVAVVCEDERFAYEELLERTFRLSNALRGLGLKQGDRVAYFGYNCHRLLEAYYGVVQAGFVLVPLNVRLTPWELRYVLRDCEPRVLIVDPNLIDKVEEIRTGVHSVEHFITFSVSPREANIDGRGVPNRHEWIDYDRLLDSYPSQPFELEFREDDLAELFYTSGTTGRLKGVMLSHRNLYANALNFIISLTLTDRDVQLHTIPLFHVNGWGTPHALTAVGGTHVMIRGFDPARAFALIERERVTLACMVPTMVGMLLNHPDRDKYDLSSFKRLVVGGAPSPVEYVRRVEEQFGWDYVGSYGLTETSPVLTMGYVKTTVKDLPGPELWRIKAKPGLGVMSAEIRVVNEKGEEVRWDGKETGEVMVRGDIVMLGYWNQPEETARTIVDGWLCTGDLATVDEEGYIQIVDRKKDIIVSGGENISSLELENVIYSHPGVAEVAVIAVPDEQWGEVPKAIVVRKSGEPVTEEDIIRFCGARVARYKIPKSVEFVDSLPKSGTGKILKNVLREPYWKHLERRVN